mgnify:CR=1 FL=1
MGVSPPFFVMASRERPAIAGIGRIDHPRAAHLHRLGSGGVLLVADIIDESALASKKAINVAMVGALSRYLADVDGAAIPDDAWETAIRANLPERFHDMNLDAFRIGRESADKNRNAQ